MPRLLALAFALTLLATPAPAASYGKPGEWMLALTWTPGFCETIGRRRPAECAQEQDAFDAVNFALHGLWPQWDDYCGVSAADEAADQGHEWGALPEVELPPYLAKAMATLMPGSESHLDRHEWIKHGTCSGMGQPAYYAVAFGLVKAMALTRTAALIRERVGGTVTYDELCGAITADFGAGALKSVKVKTRKKGGTRYLTELRFNMTSDAGPLMLAEGSMAPIEGYALRCTDTRLVVDEAGVGR